MTLEGNAFNGRIVLDGNPRLPEGVRARVELEIEEDWDDTPPPPPTETYEEHLQALKQSIESADAGEQGRSVEEVFEEIDGQGKIRSR